MKNEARNEMTGYPSIDRPWLKYYSDEAKKTKIPECTIYDYLWESNREHLDNVALNYFGYKIPYRKMFEEINKVAQAFANLGIKENDTTCPEVKTCCAIGRADKDHSQGKLPVVYITLSREKKDKMKLKEELNSLCKQMLPEYMQPIDFVFIDKMPLTANGKVDFHELEGIELSNRL